MQLPHLEFQTELTHSNIPSNPVHHGNKTSETTALRPSAGLLGPVGPGHRPAGPHQPLRSELRPTDPTAPKPADSLTSLVLCSSRPQVINSATKALIISCPGLFAQLRTGSLVSLPSQKRSPRLSRRVKHYKLHFHETGNFIRFRKSDQQNPYTEVLLIQIFIHM